MGSTGLLWEEPPCPLGVSVLSVDGDEPLGLCTVKPQTGDICLVSRGRMGGDEAFPPCVQLGFCWKVSPLLTQERYEAFKSPAFSGSVL